MTHFTLLVTKTNDKSIDEQLEYFSEHLQVEPYIAETKQEIISSHRKILQNAFDEYAKYVNGNEECQDESLTGRIKLLKERCKGKSEWTDEEIYDDFVERMQQYNNSLFDNSSWFDEDGNLVVTYNPDAKYDWYSVGGRWTGYFAKKPDGDGVLGVPGVFGNEPRENYVDIIKVKDIDWEQMTADIIKERSLRYDLEMANNIDGITKEDYINRPISHATFAILHDGVWHEQGQMGWFAYVENEKPQDEWDAYFKSIINSLDPDDEVTLVDCHI